MSLYAQRGVSAQKEEVHAAIGNLDQGLYPHAFCKIYPDYLGGSDDWINVMHADGAGTKSILAYLYWKETGDLSVWKGIAQDAVVMNLDDLLCVGVYDNMVFNSTIDRNKSRIPGEVLKAIIDGTAELFDTLRGFGVNIKYLGGETADVGDVVRTIAVNGTLTVRWPKRQLVTNQHIVPGDVIVGLASFGQSHYETAYNSGLGSNGLTSARHDVLSQHYATHYPETFEPTLAPEVVYAGPNQLTDTSPVGGQSIGQLLLSPTRTFAPVLKPLLQHHLSSIHGLVHCSGGGQTKCLKYLPDTLHVIKDNLFMPPFIFNHIQQCSGADLSEMYQVFNMGCRMEIYCPPAAAQDMIDAAQAVGVEARIIGRVETSATKRLTISTPEATVTFSHH
ncbi:MAG: phosphoribosylformylglycinamidine cyclo-ligase [Bacteroidetes bacterium]|nr:MAG: phosphoribosylformylglycinamidine cyclo-ligase [Bacteroidota bacterium]